MRKGIAFGYVLLIFLKSYFFISLNYNLLLFTHLHPRTKIIKAFLLLDQFEAAIEPPVCYELHCKFSFFFPQYKD